MTTMCRVLKIHRSGYYAWLRVPKSKRAIEDQELLVEIKKYHEESGEVYGSPRIHRDLQEVGIRCGRKRVARLMRIHKIIGQRGYKKWRHKGEKPAQTAPNLVAREFNPTEPNVVWSTDITYIRTQLGWVYLAAIMDLFSRKIVGWSVGKRMTTDLVLDALKEAIWRRNPEPGLIIHSDQGSQYGSYDWLNMLGSYGIKPSMSRRGNCYDNAVKESFFSSLKMERIRKRIYPSLEEARLDIFDYIEMFYNSKRRHGYLDFMSPNQFEKQFNESSRCL